MKKLRLHVGISAATLLAASFLGAAQTQVTADLVNQSTIIFKGRVERVSASNLRILPASDRTILVHVDEVISAAKTLNDLKGTTVTVQLKEPNSLQEGAIETFFTTGWLYGEHLALREVGHVPAEIPTASVKQRVASLTAVKSDQKLQARIVGSTLVLAGKVVAAHPLQIEGLRSNSEHDPNWWTADIEVQSVLKGSASRGERVTVLFANSNDVVWYRSPKLREGQQGVWIASEYKPGGLFPLGGAPVLAVLSPLDYQPATERERVLRLLKASQ